MEKGKERIEDVGEKIGGAKKDLYKDREFNLEDIENLNHLELVEDTKKSNIFRKLDYVKLMEQGKDVELLMAMKNIGPMSIT